MAARVGSDTPAIIVGRVPSSYTTDGVTGGLVSVTYTVYNQRDEVIDGVFLTAALAPGVTLVDASIKPDQSGGQLAWSLASLRPYERASVRVDLKLKDDEVLRLDTGAQAYGVLDAGAVTDTAPAVTLRAGGVPAGLLSSTPDANPSDPYVQEQAARLDYDPQRIFTYLRDDVGYESYAGSLRGARGTLWSAAGNSLDEASLGVALYRSAGIPARYAHGTLSDALSRQLILSMYPVADRTVGLISPTTLTADPANDPALLAEARDHFWIQFDAGSGFQDADTSFANSTVGQVFAAAQSTFSEVPDGLRHKVEVAVDAETYFPGFAGLIGALGALNGATGIPGTSRERVLVHSFNAVDLVGRPISVGNFVASAPVQTIFSPVTNTYSPYLALGDVANPDIANDELIRGHDYQEILSGFPLANQVLTGVFLQVRLIAPDGSEQTFDHSMADRFGPAARAGRATTPLSVNPDGLPLLSPLDVATFYASPSAMDSRVTVQYGNYLNDFSVTFDRLQQQVIASPPSDPIDDAVIERLTNLMRALFIGTERDRIASYLAGSDYYSHVAALGSRVEAYADSPRLSLVQSTATIDPDGTTDFDFGVDLMNDSVRAIAAPGQNPAAAIGFKILRGFMDTGFETNLFTDIVGASSETLSQNVSAQTILARSAQQGIPLVVLLPARPQQLDALGLPANATTLIQESLATGHIVAVPRSPIVIGGAPRVGWYEFDPTTGQTIGVLDDGTRGTQPPRIRPPAAPSASLGERLALEHLREITTVIMNGLGGVAASLAEGALFKYVREHFFKTKEQLGYEGDKALSVAEFLYFNSWVDEFLKESLTSDPYTVSFFAGLVVGRGIVVAFLIHDPPVPDALMSPDVESGPPANQATTTVTAAATRPAGPVAGSAAAGSIQVTGAVNATWDSTSRVALQAASLEASGATVTDASGAAVGAGAVSLSDGGLVGVSVAGSNHYSVRGNANLAAYGPALSGLGIGADWTSYTASVSGGALTLTLTTDRLSVGGRLLPAGTYTIRASQVALAGAGASSAPSFTGALTVSVTSGSVEIGPGAGNLTVGDSPLDPTHGATLVGYSGKISYTAGTTTDSIALTGTATQVLAVTAPTAPLTANQNTSVALPITLKTSLAGKYILSAEAPVGWHVAIATDGRMSITPAPGLQAGTFPVRIVARSVADGALVAQAIVDVTISATAPGVTVAATPDPVFTVPFGGAEIPSAFRVAIRNLGPAADTFRLDVAGLPSGFSPRRTASTLTVSAGDEGMLGLYLEPSGPLPPPGTVITFTVTATSTTDPTVTSTKTVSFTMPAVHGITLSVDPIALNALPDVTSSGSLILTSVGNVAETVSLTATAVPGLSLAGLPSTITLNPGQAVTIPVQATPAAATPLNSTMDTLITAELGGSVVPIERTVRLRVRVVVPGADAVADAGAAAFQLGDKSLADRLSDLSDALTNLVGTPSSPVFKGQALAAIDSIGSQLAADPFLNASVPALKAVRDQLAGASTPADVADAVKDLGRVLGTLDDVLRALVAHRFAATIAPNQALATPGVPAQFFLDLTNTGAQATTYDFAVSGLPSGVTASFDRGTITLQPGERLPAGPGVVLSVQSAANNLVPFGFTVTITARDAGGLHLLLPAALTVREALVRVTDVVTDRTYVEPGGSVRVSARVLNAVNSPQQALASFVLRDPSGQAVFTSAPVPLMLTVAASLATIDLGAVDTTGFARGAYTIAVSLTDPSGQPIPGGTGTGSLLVGSPVSATLTAGNGGLSASYYDYTTSLSTLPDLTGRAPDLTRIDPQINYSSTDSPWPGLDARFADTFAARYTGSLRVETPGAYTLYLTSDDGSRLWVDGQVVVDNDGLHAMVERAGTVTLTAGFHDLRVEFFENGGGAGLVLGWSGPGIAKQVIPASAFFTGPVPLPLGNSTVLPPGNGVVTNTLTLSAAAPLDAPLHLIGQAATTTLSTTIVVRGDIAYVAGTNGVDIVDVGDPTHPAVLSTFAGDLIVRGGFTVVRELAGDRILIGSTVTLNSNGFRLLIYSVADPLHPALLSDSSITEAFLSDLAVSGSTALVTTLGVFFSGPASAGDAFDQFGDVTAIDLDAPTGPAVADRLFGTRNPPFTGDTVQSGAVIADADTAYIASTTLSGGNFSNGVGRLLVVNYANPSSLVLTREIQIPGTVKLYNVAIAGNLALIVGTTRGDQDPWNNNDGDPSNDSGNTGNVTLTTLDITDRDNPVVLSTVVTTATFPRGSAYPITKLAVVPTGASQFAISLGITGVQPVIFLVDASDPMAPAASALAVDKVVNEMAVAGGKLYTTSEDGLLIYDIAGVNAITATAAVHVPKGTGVAIVPGSFSIAPTRVEAGGDADTYIWDRRLAYGLDSETITWQTAVTGLAPGETRDLTLGSTVDFVVRGTPGRIALPATTVSASHILALDPASQTVRPAEAASYTLTVKNPTPTPVVYTLAVQGVSAGWVSLPATVAVPANGSAEVPLVLTSEGFAALADYGFTVTATVPTGVADAAHGTITLAGSPARSPQVDAYGVVTELRPSRATVGQGTSARFVARITNVGSVADSFALTFELPAGVKVTPETTELTLQPGSASFREIAFVLTVNDGTPAASVPFRVIATSTTRPNVSGASDGTLDIRRAGVSATLSPGTGTPGQSYSLTVVNTGNAADTFDLALVGPLVTVATLDKKSVILAPGASQVIPIHTGPINFAEPVDLRLVAVARSHEEPAVFDDAVAALTVPTAKGFTASFLPQKKTLSRPGTAVFLLNVDNVGNVEDRYEAEIVGTTGPIRATLDSLEGVRVAAVPSFYVPGLARAVIPLRVSLAAAALGTVSVRVRSMTTGRTVTTTASLAVATVATTTQISAAPQPARPGQPVSLTAVVAASADGVPTGNVTFTVDGVAQTPVPLRPAGSVARAVLVLPGLEAGTHAIRASYGGGGRFLGSAAAGITLTVVSTADTVGPTITQVQRFGYHAQPTQLVITVSEPLNAAAASNRAGYSLVAAGPDGRFGTRDDVAIPIRAVSYDASRRAITLDPAHRLSLWRPYRLVVLGTGDAAIKDVVGNALDGDHDGRRGGTAVITINRRLLAGGILGGPVKGFAPVRRATTVLAPVAVDAILSTWPNPTARR